MFAEDAGDVGVEFGFGEEEVGGFGDAAVFELGDVDVEG